MKIRIQNDERVVIVGGTGSGKTILAKHFLKRLNRVMVVDPKHTFKLEGFARRRSLPVFGKMFRIIVRPRLDDDWFLADLFREVFRGRNATIYVDELASLSEMFPNATVALADIARTGRERHVAVWTALQRPRWVPRVFFTEAEAIFQFNLRSGEDRAYMSQFAGPLVRDTIERFTFWYSHANMPEIDPALMRLDLGRGYIEKIG